MTPTLLVLIDGLRPDAILDGQCANINNLRENGSSSLKARSVMPSITLPCITSIFHSVLPERHGTTTNVYQPQAQPVPGLFDLVAGANLRAAFFYNWEQLRDLNRPGSLSFAYFRANAHDVEGDLDIASQASRFIGKDHPDFVFVYLGTLDSIGHDHGWMSEAYFAQLDRVDSALGTLLDRLPDDYAVVLQSDHGGHEKNHGTESADDMTIPWLAAGPGIREGHVIQSPVTLLDTAPTIAHMLGLTPHAEWTGRVIEEIFE